MVKITACVITKNEEHNIGCWLDNMKAITKDLVVVDTGSTDGTAALARAAGAKVYDYEWQNDFAAAKNFAIEQARGQWIIFLDADEYFTAASLKNVRKHIKTFHFRRDIDAVACRLVNVDADDNDRYISELYNIRMFRNDPALRYVRPVHEMLERKNGELQIHMLPSGVEIYHTGYSGSIVKRKLERNLAIIMKEVNVGGEQPRHYRYLCECYYGLKNYELVEKYAALHVEKGERALGDDNYIHKRLLESMILLKRDEAAIMAKIAEFKEQFPDDPEFCWYEGQIMYLGHDYGAAEGQCRRFLELCKRSKNNYSHNSLRSKVRLAYGLMGWIQELKGDYRQAVDYFVWSLREYKYNDAVLAALFKLAGSGAAPADLPAILTELYQASETDAKFIAATLDKQFNAAAYEFYGKLAAKLGLDKAIDVGVIYDAVAVKRLGGELADCHKRLLAILSAQPSLYEADKFSAVMPRRYELIRRRLNGETVILPEAEQAVMDEVVNMMPPELQTRRGKRPHDTAVSGGTNKELYRQAWQAYSESHIDEALSFIETALAQSDEYDAELYKLRGQVYFDSVEYAKCAAALRESLRRLRGVHNDFAASVAQGLGAVYRMMGDPAAAAGYYLKACEWASGKEDKAANYSAYLLCLHYRPDIPDEELAQRHRAYERLVRPERQYTHTAAAARPAKIRIGYLSPDFREHVMLNFYYALLRQYNRDAFFVACYSLGGSDAVTEHLRQSVDLWRDLRPLSAADAAKVINDDGIDILVELAGHSANSGLPIMAYKPAAVQLSGLGYFNTTGLTAVDYFITDGYLDPAGRHDELFTERLLRLPDSHFCYIKQSNLPSSPAAPCLKNGYITFGCFNQYAKITDEMLAAWRRIMTLVPGSRLTLRTQACNCEETRAAMAARMEALEMDMTRIDLLPTVRDYLAKYLDIDIALDTYPYPGGGTTCDALYMGAPVVSLYGERHGSRFGYSILSNIGLGELASPTVDAYIERAVALAGDREVLNLLHKNLRQLMLSSPLMDAAKYVSGLEEEYRRLYDEFNRS